MASDRQSESDRRIKILDYVRNKSLDEKAKKINKSDVMRYMQDASRVMTTHKIIVDLIKEGKIKTMKDKPHSQTHYLTINEKNEFNKIYNTLLEIENHIDSMDSFAAAIRKLQTESDIREYETKRKDKEPDPATVLVLSYRIWYGSVIDSMLHFLLAEVAKRNLNPQDSEILYKKIVRLLQKMSSQRGLRDLKEGTNWLLNDHVSKSEQQINEHAKYFQKYAKIYEKYNLDFAVRNNLRDDLLKIIKDFQEGFLG